MNAIEDIDIFDADDLPYSSPVVVKQRGPQRPKLTGSASRQKEVIEDSEEDEPPLGLERCQLPAETVPNEPIDSSPPGLPAEALDDDFEMLFGPDTECTKRRRLSPNHSSSITSSTKPGRLKADAIPISSPEPPSPYTNHPSSPGWSQAIPRRRQVAVPAETPGSSTPGNMRTPIGSRHRFMLSATQQQPASHVSPHTPAPASPPRKQKPAFILPPSPSVSREQEGSPSLLTPFSPSSRRLHRHGRPRAVAPSYLPGGMAAEVRSWILEVATKQDQLNGSWMGSRSAAKSRSPDNGNYLMAVKVEDARQGALCNSGPVTFIKGRQIPMDMETGFDDAQSGHVSRNIVLLGPPSSKRADERSSGQTSVVGPKDVVGVRRNLVWEVNLNDSTAITEYVKPEKDAREDRISVGPAEKWLVGMEWDML